MSRFKAKMHQILFPASVRSCVRLSLRWSLIHATFPLMRLKPHAVLCGAIPLVLWAEGRGCLTEGIAEGLRSYCG